MDEGSTCSLITHKLAEFLGLKGVSTVQWMEVAGKPFEPVETFKYKLLLKDRNGDYHKLNLLGMEKITSNSEKVDISAAYKVFPHITVGDLDRPTGEVGILLG